MHLLADCLDVPQHNTKEEQKHGGQQKGDGLHADWSNLTVTGSLLAILNREKTCNNPAHHNTKDRDRDIENGQFLIDILINFRMQGTSKN